MKPQIFAILTAIAWGVGGYFKKKGLHLGNLAPQMGITIRTFVALILLGFVSFPDWQSVSHAGPKALLYMIIGGGIVAGAVGITLFISGFRDTGCRAILACSMSWRCQDGDSAPTK